MRTHHWRMSEHEMTKRLIIRALRRDAPKRHTWKSRITWVADRIENGEITIEMRRSPSEKLQHA